MSARRRGSKRGRAGRVVTSIRRHTNTVNHFANQVAKQELDDQQSLEDMITAFTEALEEYGMLTENGALSHDSTGKACLNYFAKCGTYRGRDQSLVNQGLSAAWEDSPLLTLRCLFYLRMVSRTIVKSKEVNYERNQAGQGQRDEFYKGILFLHNNHPEALYANLWAIPLVGRWSDLWADLLINVLDRQQVYELVKQQMDNEYQAPLIAKWLPQIRARSKCKTDRKKNRVAWAKGLCKYLGWTFQQYRKYKANPEFHAHITQRVMCAQDWDQINFSEIPGKQLFLMMGRKGKDGKTVLERHGQIERYIEWIREQPTAKFTGYVYELFTKARKSMGFSTGYTTRAIGGVMNPTTIAERVTYDKQFEGLIADGKFTENVLCALDTSGSMNSRVVGDTSAYDICVSLGIYFSALNEGSFKDTVCMFDSECELLTLEGSFTEKTKQIAQHSTAWGGTNFQSVIDLIVRVRQERPDISIADYPTTLLVVSDMQFNPAKPFQRPAYGYSRTGNKVPQAKAYNPETNYEVAMQKLASVGLPHMKIVWWWVTGRADDFPSTISDEGVTMIGGFDGSIMSLLLDEEEELEAEDPDAMDLEEEPQQAAQQQVKKKLNPWETMCKALSQPILRELRLA